MKLKAEDARDVAWGDHPDFVTVKEEVDDTTRWSVLKSGIFKHTPSGKHYSLCWSEGATEQQDERPFEFDTEVELIEVEEVETVVYTWLPTKKVAQ